MRALQDVVHLEPCKTLLSDSLYNLHWPLPQEPWWVSKTLLARALYISPAMLQRDT